MADAGGLQLLPETRKKIKYQTPGQNKLLLFSLIFLALIFAIYGGLYYYRGKVEKDFQKVENDIKANEESRSLTEENKLLALKDSLSVIGPLINDHIAWSAALVRIQKLILPQVQFDNLGVKFNQKKYSFKAYAYNFATIAKQIAAFYGDEAINDVTIGRISSQTDGRVEFSIELTIDAKKFTAKKSAE